MLLELAADANRLDYLQARLDEEQRREQLGASTLRWSDLLDPDDLSGLRDALTQPDTSRPDLDPGRMARRAVEMLATLYQARNHAERERRAHDRVRDARLQWVTRWLLLLLVPAAALLVVAFSLAGSSRQVEWLEDAVRIALVLMVGGLGSALSGTRSTPPSPSPQSDRADHPNR
jgi:lipopolysaccharide export LptBFGC system permease protein LptF